MRSAAVKVLITGGGGQLARAIGQCWSGHEVDPIERLGKLLRLEAGRYTEAAGLEWGRRVTLLGGKITVYHRPFIFPFRTPFSVSSSRFLPAPASPIRETR